MTQQTLAEALSLTADGAGGLTARLTGGFSNAPQSAPQARGAPFGGLMAALAAGAMRQGLGIETPLQSLTIQYLAPARFEDAVFTPVMNRGGRNVAYASVIGGQGDRPAIQALGTWGRDVAGPVLTPLTASPPPFEDLDPTPLDPAFGPWFTRHIDHRFVAGPKLFGENAGGTPELGCWMRAVDAAPLDEARLLFLLDGLFHSFPGASGHLRQRRPPRRPAGRTDPGNLAGRLGLFPLHQPRRRRRLGRRGRRGLGPRRPPAGARATAPQADADARLTTYVRI